MGGTAMGVPFCEMLLFTTHNVLLRSFYFTVLRESTRTLAEQNMKEIKNPRPDYQVTEEDLWVKPPFRGAGLETE